MYLRAERKSSGFLFFSVFMSSPSPHEEKDSTTVIERRDRSLDFVAHWLATILFRSFSHAGRKRGVYMQFMIETRDRYHVAKKKVTG